MPANVENSAVSTGLEKVSFHSDPKERQCQRMLNYYTIAVISHASKVMLKILQVGFNNMWTVNFQMFKLVLEKAEEPEIKLPISIGSSKKQENSRKTSTSALLTMPKPLTVWITTNFANTRVFGDGNTRPPDLPLEKSICRSGRNRTGHGTTDWFQIGKGVCWGSILSPCLFNLHAQ